MRSSITPVYLENGSPTALTCQGLARSIEATAMPSDSHTETEKYRRKVQPCPEFSITSIEPEPECIFYANHCSRNSRVSCS
jgi:hypothetical protein